VRSLGLLALVVAALGVTATTSPWVASAAAAIAGRPFTFARVFDRLFEVLLGVGLLCAWRPLDLGTAASLGLQRDRWGRGLGRGIVLALVGLAVGVAVATVAGALEPALRYPPGKTLRKAAAGVVAAVILGGAEEILFRGVLLRRLARDLGLAAALATTTAIYAAVHVMRTAGVDDSAGAGAGWMRLASFAAPFTRGAAWPQVFGLAMLGLLLGAAKLQSGGLWVPIGIHAAWVALFRVGRLFFTLHATPVWVVGSGWPPFVGGVAGWTAIAVSAALLRRGARSRAPAAGSGQDFFPNPLA